MLTPEADDFPPLPLARWPEKERGKEVNIMNYEKPQITNLGNASRLIEGCAKISCVGDGGAGHTAAGAYDLDE